MAVRQMTGYDWSSLYTLYIMYFMMERSVWRRIYTHYDFYNSSVYSVLCLYLLFSSFPLCLWLALLSSLLPLLLFGLSYVCNFYLFYNSCILLTSSFFGSCRGAASRFMMNTVGIMKRPRGCCWSLTRSGVFGHVYWWEGALHAHIK